MSPNSSTSSVSSALPPSSVTLERIGFGATLASRKPADKQMVELLTGAVFTMFLDEANDYYVKPVKDDPPDVEVLAVERDSRAFSTMKLEIVQDGKYSESVFEVIGKKLAKGMSGGLSSWSR